jgi:ABC-type polysaccharide/polyol phosphate export permease
MPNRNAKSPSLLEMLEEVVNLSVGVIIVLLPVLILAVPGAVVLIVLPAILLLAAAAIPVAIVGAIAAPPYLLARMVRRRRS